MKIMYILQKLHFVQRPIAKSVKNRRYLIEGTQRKCRYLKCRIYSGSPNNHNPQILHFSFILFLSYLPMNVFFLFGNRLVCSIVYHFFMFESKQCNTFSLFNVDLRCTACGIFCETNTSSPFHICIRYDKMTIK